MIYNLVSIEKVISTLLRYTRLTDSSYSEDIYHFIIDGMDQLRTRYKYKRLASPLRIISSSAKLPVGLNVLEAVSYNGCRLRNGSDTRGASSNLVNCDYKLTVLQSSPENISELQNIKNITETHQPLIPLDGSDLKIPITFDSKHFYDINAPYISTSFDTGYIIVYYLAYRVDKDGWPLIPDNTSYKLALVWWTRAALIGAGYKDPVFNYDQCMQKFDEFSDRATAEVNYPNKDMQERITRALTKPVFNVNAWEGYFHNNEQYSGTL